MREERLVRARVEFLDQLVSDDDVAEFLTLLCQRFVKVMQISAAGAVVSDRRGRLRVATASTPNVAALEALQVQRHQGPCVDAHRWGRRVAVADLRRMRERWPVFVPRALEAGIAAVYAFPMRLRAARIGALDVFLHAPGELDEAATQAGQVLTDLATIAILQARAAQDATRLAAQLEHALESRVVVEQAKGVLAERLGVDPDVAFLQLRRYGRARGLHLTELARQVVDGSITLDG
jgi:transcriptional regulator with GAF, ATPase, and Fis domain